MRFEFGYLLSRDNEIIGVSVEANVCRAEPDVGIMSDYVDDCIVRHDGQVVTLTDKEYDALMDDANERLQELQENYYEDNDP